jgi:WD40 repeat protein
VTPDNRYAISGAGDKKIKIWDLSKRQEQQTLAGHKGEILSLTLTPDGRTLASACHDTSIRLWDVVTGQALGALTAHTGPVTGVSFAADGRLLASKSADDSVRLWRCDTWETVAILAEPHSSFAFSSLAFHPQCPVLATLDDKDRVIRIWDLDLSKWLASN